MYSCMYTPIPPPTQANEIEHPGVDIKGFPTILFFPNGKKDSPVKYEGPREVNDFIDFLKEASTKAFEVRFRVLGSVCLLAEEDDDKTTHTHKYLSTTPHQHTRTYHIHRWRRRRRPPWRRTRRRARPRTSSKPTSRGALDSPLFVLCHPPVVMAGTGGSCSSELCVPSGLNQDSSCSDQHGAGGVRQRGCVGRCPLLLSRLALRRPLCVRSSLKAPNRKRPKRQQQAAGSV